MFIKNVVSHICMFGYIKYLSLLIFFKFFHKNLYNFYAFSRKFPSVYLPLYLSKKYNFKILNVYDIGANEGYWTKYRRSLYRKAKFIMFEANKKHEIKIKKIGEKYFIVTLSDTVKNVDFYDIGGAGDSYYKENTNYYKNVKPQSHKTKTLDMVIENNNLPIPDYIKIDTQGSEIDILKGFSKNINKVKLISLEISLHKYNEGSLEFKDYFNFMYSNDFIAYDIIERRNNANIIGFEGLPVLNGIDILFLNKRNIE